MFETSKGVFEGTREEVLNELKKRAKSGCKKCFGRGYIGYKEDKKTGIRQYVPCKCIDK